jgi:hypothetical protein
MILCFFIAYLDRVNAGFAALTMNKELVPRAASCRARGADTAPNRRAALRAAIAVGALASGALSLFDNLEISAMNRSRSPSLIMRVFAQLKLLWETRAQRAAIRRLFRSRRS